jgi:hypothetical protein
MNRRPVDNRTAPRDKRCIVCQARIRKGETAYFSMSDYACHNDDCCAKLRAAPATGDYVSLGSGSALGENHTTVSILRSIGANGIYVIEDTSGVDYSVTANPSRDSHTRRAWQLSHPQAIG